MNSPKCGNNVNEGEQYCRHCGNKLELTTNNNINPPQSNINTNVSVQPQVITDVNMTINSNNPTNNEVTNQIMPIESPVINQTVLQANNLNNINEEELLKEYIGKNYEGIINKKFSWCSFFFGAIYYLYRKMWLLGICWVIGTIILNWVLPTYTSLAVIVSGIIISVKFKGLYINQTTEKIS